MQLGASSISLAVKDLAASRAFYEKLGFETSDATLAQNYLIMTSIPGGTRTARSWTPTPTCASSRRRSARAGSSSSRRQTRARPAPRTS